MKAGTRNVVRGTHVRPAAAGDLVAGLRVLRSAGVIGGTRPDRLLRSLGRIRRYGFSAGGALASAAVKTPDRIAVVDDEGSFTYRRLDEDAAALAAYLWNTGSREGTRIGVLMRNHRGYHLVSGAVARIGADLVLLNTEASAHQLADVVAEQGLTLLIADGEFLERLGEIKDAPPVLQAWTTPDHRPQGLARTGGSGGDGDSPGPTGLAKAIELGCTGAPLPGRPRRGRLIFLTSGTTGTPKGAQRPEPKNWMPIAALLSRIPFREGERILVAAPLFHGWGWANYQIGLSLGSTLVLQRRFRAENSLEAARENQAGAMVVVPTMLARMVALPDTDRPDLPALRILASSGSALTTSLVRETRRRFGDVLHNFYGATEVAWATIAQPHEMAAHPATAGRPPLGTTLLLLDEAGHRVPDGEVGRVFVGNSMVFEGYTRPGADKERHGDLVCTGDLGHIGPEGLLFIDGRTDDMIVSGGENVYPREVEDLLAGEDGVAEVAVVGADDPEFRKRLVAYIVRTDDGAGAALTQESVQSLVRSHLACFCVPRDVVFLPCLPRNAMGKVVPRLLPPPQPQEAVPPVDAGAPADESR
ncbi:AMP-binding protein [Streptomyces noursei]|uniref:AMP-binding protein n=1 Tax=Streptomyces noursei TaxID=1971 RepID=UPI00196237EB|nr:AMP-binding protein [Streptomyces noursei]QRX89965.1 AMP-binding protein [Streptomyces noursei]